MNQIIEHAQKALSRIGDNHGVSTKFERGFDVQPTPLSNQCRAIAHSACDAVGIETLSMHSGAFHDTMHIANATDAILLFAPSQDGVSHSPCEWTDWEECSTATQALTETLATLSE